MSLNGIRNSLLGPVSRKSRELFGPEKSVLKLQSACFEKLIFLHVCNVRKAKRTAKFEGLEPRRCEDKKAIVAPEIGPKSFGTFEKLGPDLVEFYFLAPQKKNNFDGREEPHRLLLEERLAQW